MSEMDVNPGRIDPAAIKAGDLAQLLSAASGVRIDEQSIRADIAAGAPTNTGDGDVLNIVHYAAWLVRQLAAQGGGARGGD